MPETNNNAAHLNRIMLAEMSREFPDAQVTIVWDDSTSASHAAFDAPAEVALGELMGKRVSEALTSKENYQNLCNKLGEPLVELYAGKI